jgi:phosphoenolpyruvate carboxylase
MPWPPITMATQHPDNASIPWWRSDAFIPTQDELDELLLLFRELSIDEYMWDWEGKHVDEAVGEKIYARAHEFFSAHPLGDEFHLTYRIPALDHGEMHRMARAFMNILSLGDLAHEMGLQRPPVTEMFLPLTRTADEPLQVRQKFREVAGYHRAIFHPASDHGDALLQLFEVTPLVEDVESLCAIERILEPYWTSLLKEKKDHSRGQRIFLARSDPAVNAGVVPAVLAVKVALSKSAELGERLGIPVHPIIGTGALPFRGSVNPTYVETFLPQYAGTRTYSIQSAFRYDYPLEDAKTALAKIREEAPRLEVVHVPPHDIDAVRSLIAIFSEIWQPTIEALAPLVNDVAQYIPPRRERLQHIGLFGYSRGVGNVKLPRAIGFTCALYSIGVPPELIATGRGLRAARRQGLLKHIDTYYPALREDLHHAGKYLNRENIELLSERYPIFREVGEGIRVIEEVLGIRLGPEKPHHVIHRNLTSTIVRRLQETKRDADVLTRDIVEAGKIRRSLG